MALVREFVVPAERAGGARHGHRHLRPLHEEHRRGAAEDQGLSEAREVGGVEGGGGGQGGHEGHQQEGRIGLRGGIFVPKIPSQSVGVIS